MSFSKNLSRQLLDHVFNNTTYTQPTNIYVALSTADPGDTGASIAEPVGDGYTRVTTDNTYWNAATDADPSEIDNALAVTFPEVDAAGDWGLCTHFALFDHLTLGAEANFLGGAILSGGSKQPTDGDTPRFSVGALTVTLT